ncbi:MAG: transposase, partial [Solobacterium sp.]|nr:transposase [Solobacterium sp.]
MKYELGIPFYRYGNYLCQKGFTISEADICHWAARSMELLEPLYDRLFETLLKTEIKVLHIDETPLKVINDEKTRCYMFVCATTYWEEPIYIYSFSDTRSTREMKEILRDYDGYAICDGYSGYDSLPDQGIKVQRCIVHLIRNSIKYVPAKDYKKYTTDLKRVYGAANLKAGRAAFDTFCENWKQYPGAVDVWKR